MVLYISYNGATEPITNSQIIPYLKGLSARGCTFDLLTFEKRNSAFQNVKRSGILKKELNGSNINWFTLRYHKSPTLIATAYDTFMGIIYSAYLIAKRKYAIVHARQIVPAAICVMLRPFFRIKWVFDMRGLVAEEYVGHGAWREGGVKFRLVKWFEKMAILSADHIVVLTERHRQTLISLPFLKGKDASVSVIPCCVDMFRFRPMAGEDRKEAAAKLGLSDGFILLYIGSLGTCYLLDEMLAFFKILKERAAKAMFLFLTDYNSGEIISKAKNAGIEEGSVMVRFAEPPETHMWIALADAGIFFINPYKKIGSSPIKMGEFLASGIPVIINPGIGDTEELVRDNRVGVVVRNFSEKDYRGGLTELMRLKEGREELKKRCRDTARKYLSVDDAVSKYARIYDILNTANKTKD